MLSQFRDPMIVQSFDAKERQSCGDIQISGIEATVIPIFRALVS
jgi:hypothetical protein